MRYTTEYIILGTIIFLYLNRENLRWTKLPPKSPPVSLMHPFRAKKGQRPGWRSVAPVPTNTKGLFESVENLSERSNFSADTEDSVLGGVYGVLDRGLPGEAWVRRKDDWGPSKILTRQVPDPRERLGYRTVFVNLVKPGLRYASNSIVKQMPDGRTVYRTKEGKLTYDRYEGRRD